jgi:hypothetical protein
MVSRKVVTDKHRTIAKLLLSGESFYRALRQCGYSRASARNPKLVLAHCWGLRQAILEAQKASSMYFRVPPARKRRHDRRPVARFTVAHCNGHFEETASNRGVREYIAAEKIAERINKGLPPAIPKRPSESLVICPNPHCHQKVRATDLFLDQTASFCSCCVKCAQ